MRKTNVLMGAIGALGMSFSGCTGSIEAPDGQVLPAATLPTTQSDVPNVDLGLGEDPEASVAAINLRVLTAAEYNHTVQDLMGDDSSPADRFPAESNAETGFLKVKKLDQVNVAAYQNAALALAARADVQSVFGCDPELNEATCVDSFVRTFVPRAYRRPLSESEVAQHLDYYQDVLRGDLGYAPAEASQLLLAAVLQSPYFLYRWELGYEPVARDGNVAQLGEYHLASQLSYFLWSSMPDSQLLDAAAAGRLRSADQIAAQVQRMLQDPKAERTITHFHQQWLGMEHLPDLGKSAGMYPEWSRDLGTAMESEISRFTSNVLLEGDGRVETLLTSRSTFVNQALADVYGLAGVNADAWVARELPATERAGLLTLAGFLTAHSGETEANPIFRGKFVRERVLCSAMAPPPADVPDLPEPSPEMSKRERFSEHASVSPCSSCHVLMDPIGFGFDNYDAIGAYKETENGEPIDVTGQVQGLDGANPTFDGPLELMQLLSQSEHVKRCVMTQWFRFALARRELDADAASLDAAYARFVAADYNVRELITAFATSPAFMYRLVTDGEVL